MAHCSFVKPRPKGALKCGSLLPHLRKQACASGKKYAALGVAPATARMFRRLFHGEEALLDPMGKQGSDAVGVGEAIRLALLRRGFR